MKIYYCRINLNRSIFLVLISSNLSFSFFYSSFLSTTHYFCFSILESSESLPSSLAAYATSISQRAQSLSKEVPVVMIETKKRRVFIQKDEGRTLTISTLRNSE